MVGLLAIATVPAGVVGGLFHHQVEEAATPLVFIGAAFILTAFMNWPTRGRGGGGGGGNSRDPGVARVGGLGAQKVGAAAGGCHFGSARSRVGRLGAEIVPRR